MKVLSKNNKDGTYTYVIFLANKGPILPNVTTPKDHTVTDWSSVPPTNYDASGKYLTEDENIVVFGIDTGEDEIEITQITNANSAFHGSVENGFSDSDGDGIPNKVVAWHLPFFGWTLADTVAPGSSIKGLRFKSNKKLENVLFWVGGSDDARIWDQTHIMVEDGFGIYDATDGEYLAVFFENTVKIKELRFPFPGIFANN